tara:strand:+ start:276 stop:461 length:186 start_codon:yes stop_codon:yes gene_type:complete
MQNDLILREQVVYGSLVEETLNLSAVQIHCDHAAWAHSFHELSNSRRRDRDTRLDLPADEK